jgi:transposase
MTGDPLPAATRVRKVRRSSRVGCGHYVLTGQVIVRRAGKWACLPCALAAIGARAQDHPAPGGAAQEGTT